MNNKIYILQNLVLEASILIAEMRTEQEQNAAPPFEHIEDNILQFPTFDGRLHIPPTATPSPVSKTYIDNLRQPENAKSTLIKPKGAKKIMAYIKDNKLYPKGTIRQRTTTGRWEIRYMDGGRQKTIERKTQIEVLNVYNDILLNLDKDPKRTEKHTLFSMLDKWLKEEILPTVRTGRKRERNKISRVYAKSIQATIRNHIKKHFANKPLDDIKVFELEEQSRTINYSRSRENADSVLNMALKWAHKKQFMKNNITEHFKKHKHEREQGKPFSRIDQERILEYARLHSKYYFEFVFYFYTGARPAEIRTVRHCDFDFANNTVFIDGTKTRTSSRKIPLLKPLHEFRERITNSTDFIFPSKIDTYRAELHDIMVALGIDTNDYTLKSTRHSFATRLKEKGIEMKTISLWLGHTNIQMTDNYAHVLSEFEQLQAEKFNQSFNDHP